MPNIRDYLPELYENIPWLNAYYDATQEVIYDQLTELFQKIIELRNPDLAEEEFLGSLMKLLGFFVPFAHLTVPDRRRLIKELPFFYTTSGTDYFIKFLSYNINAKVVLFNLYTNRRAAGLILRTGGSNPITGLISPAPMLPGLSIIPPTADFEEDPPTIAKGFVGNLVLGVNQDSAGALSSGNLRITGTTIQHPDGTPRTITPPIQINTQFFGDAGRTGLAYLMWTDELPNTRFAPVADWWIDNGGTDENIIPVIYDSVENKWYATPGLSPDPDFVGFPQEEIVPDITDLIIGRIDRTSIAIPGLSSGSFVTSDNIITDGVETFTDTGEDEVIALQTFVQNLEGWTNNSVGAFNAVTWDPDERMMKFDFITAGGGNLARTRRTFPTVIGAAYVVETYIAEKSPGAGKLTLNVGTSAGGTQYGTLTRQVQSHYARTIFIATTTTCHTEMVGPTAGEPTQLWVEHLRFARVGRAFSDAGGTGIIDYVSGLYSLTWDTAPGGGTNITASLLTNVYQNIVPFNEITGPLVEDGGDWYLTNLVGVDYDLLKFPNLQALADIFYRIAPAPLVLYVIQTAIVEAAEVNVIADGWVIEVIYDSNAGQIYPSQAGDIGSVDGTEINILEVNMGIP